MKIEASTSSSQWYREADNQVFIQGLPVVEKIQEKLDVYVPIVNSIRRIAKIYSLQPTDISPEMINDERRLLGKNSYDLNIIRENLDYHDRLLLAFDTLIQTHVHTANYFSFRDYNVDDLTDHARELIAKNVVRNIDFSSLANTPPDKWLNQLVHYVSAILKKLPGNFNATYPYEFSFEFLSDNVIDRHLSPEESVIQKEWILFFVNSVQSLPEPQRRIISDLIFDKNGYEPNEVNNAKIMLAEKLELTFPNDNHKQTKHDNRSLFQGLSLYQVFGLISRLSVYQQIALLHKFDYIYPDKTDLEVAKKLEISSESYRSFRQYAWKNIRKMLDAGELYVTDSFYEELQSLNLFEPVQHPNGKIITTRALSTIISHQNSPYIKNLTLLQRQVFEEIIRGSNYAEIATNLNLTYRSVKIHASRISTILRSE